MATYAVGLSGRTYTNVNAAITAAIAANDTAAIITVAAGTYNTGTNAVMNPSQWGGWRILPCSIQAEDSANKPIFDGTSLGNVTRAVNLTGAAPLEATSGRVTLKNLIFQNWADQTNGVIDLSGGSAVPVTIDGCEFKTLTGSAIPILPGTAATAGNYSVVKNCLFLNVTKHSVRGTAGGVCNHATIYNNRFYGGNSAGYAVYTDGSTWLVYNNSFYFTNSNTYGIVAFTIKNNAIHIQAGKSLTAAIYAGGTGNLYDYNLVYGTNGGYFGNSGGHIITPADPLFTSPSTGDFSISSSSPCYNAGTTVTVVDTDYRGMARPQGAAYDVGAYEVLGTTTVSSITVLGTTSIRLNLAASIASDSTWATAGNFTITTGAGAAVTVSSAAASGNPGSSITLTTSEHTNGATYNVAWTGLTNITSGNSNYTGLGTAPTVQTVTMTSPTNVNVTFSESMINEAALTTAANYTITGSGAPFHPTSVTRVSATQVALTLGQSCGAASATLAVSGPRDLAQNVCGDSRTFSVFTTTVSGATAMTTWTGYKVRLTLTDATYEATGWASATVTISGSTSLTPVYITPASPASYIEFTIGEQEAGASYTITWSGLVGVTNGSTTFTGLGGAPSLSSITVQDKNTVVVVWIEDMLNEAALVAPANYTFTPASGVDTITTTAVVRNTARQVTITTTDQTPGRLYDILFVGPRDLAHNVANVSAADAVTGFATSLIAAEARSEAIVRVTFARGVADSSDLRTTTNYTFECLDPVAPLAPIPVVTAVTVPTDITTYVDLTVDRQGLDQLYRVTAAAFQGITGGAADFVGVAAHNHQGFASGAPAAGKWGSGG